MTDRAPETPVRHPLEGQHRRHRRALLLRHALRGASWCTVAITLAVLLGVAWSPGVIGAWLRLAALVVAGLVAIGFAAARFSGEVLSLDGFLERVEERFPDLRSWIRNAVDFERARFEHVSADLARALGAEASRRLAEAPLASLTPPIAPRRPAWRMGGAMAAIVVAALLLPGRTSRSWETLWSPAAAAPPVLLSVEPGSVTVTPGATLAVRARVWGTDRAPRLDRSRPPAGGGSGAVSAVPEGREERGARVWRFDLAQLTHPQEYRVQVAGVSSPRYHIALSGSLAPVSFEVEYRAPGYARMPIQRGTAARGDLTALRGTTATLVATFDRDLERLEARLTDGRSATWTALTPRRWRGVVPITRDGEYELAAVARREAGRGDAGASEGRFRYRVTALADAPPLLVVQLPQGDVDLPTGQQIPLDLLAQDDLGLTELTLQFRKDAEGPWSDVALARFAQQPREARVETRWDASALALLPGESASFHFVLFDDNAVSGRGRAVSPTFELRFPSLAELYDRVDERQAGAQKELEKVTDQARELQKSLDKLARQQPRLEQAPSTSFERSEELRSALERQQEIGRHVEEAAQQLRQSLEQAAERNAFDEELMAKLRQVTELMQQIQSEEFKEALRKMREALEKMDRLALERKIPEWRAANQEILKNLERTIELLKRLREEEKLQAMAQRAEELKAQQDALNREHQESSGRKPSERENLAARQERAAEESRQLAKEARAMAENSGEPENRENLSEAADELGQQAASAQQQAAEAASKSQSDKAQASGEQASKSLGEAAALLRGMAARMQSQQQALNLAAVRRAAQDLVSLQRTSEDNLSSDIAPGEKADRQTDLSEGTARVADSLFQLSRETPFITPRLSEALGRAINNFMGSGKELSSGNRTRGEESGQRAMQSLNEAVLELRATENSMCDKPGSGLGGKINPRRVGDLGVRQSQVNRETRSLAQRLSEQMRLSASDRDQMRRLAEEQARIREQLEEIRRDEESQRELLGRLDQAGREMKEVEEVLRQGAMDGELEEKQQRILSRLLDAQRSVNRRDYDPQRQSRPGEDVARTSPAELPAELLRQSDRFRQDLLKSELDRYPPQYRAFVETYLRLLNGSRR